MLTIITLGVLPPMLAMPDIGMPQMPTSRPIIMSEEGSAPVPAACQTRGSVRYVRHFRYRSDMFIFMPFSNCFDGAGFMA